MRSVYEVDESLCFAASQVCSVGRPGTSKKVIGLCRMVSRQQPVVYGIRRP